jgi:type VI secretion system secreted protein VgrG
MKAPTQSSSFLALKTKLGADVLLIERFSGDEALGRLYDYRAQALAPKDEFDLDSLIGTNATLKMENAAHGGAKYRFFNGIVSQVNHLGYDAHGYGRYELALVPWLWLLTRTSDCRIFQNLSVPEIIKKVFDEQSTATYRMELEGKYEPREYCVQYRETDFNFVQRLMENEGIYYFWEHRDGEHKMVICDSSSSHKPVEGFEKVHFRALDSGIQERFQLFTWQIHKLVTPGKYALNSFDFKSPKPSANTKLLSRSDKEHKHKEGGLEIYDNPGNFLDRSDGKRLAVIRREEIQCQSNTISRRTNARGLFCGSTFESTEIPRKDQNKEYLITSTSFNIASGNYGSGTGSGENSYECAITGILKTVPFRAARVAVPTRVEGPQTAIVSGPSGEEIHVDKYGRVKVQFLWDRDGAFDSGSSCWIRVSQAWAGVGFGSMNIPRIGQEVIVDFLEGDPDRPIIVGRVYNGSNMPHSSNAGRDGKPGNTPPADLTQAAMMTSFKSNSLGGSGGHNEITMNDKGGAETLFFKAQKDEIHKVGNDREDEVANDETRTIGHDRVDTVGNNETRTVGQNRVRTVGSCETVTVGSMRTHTVGVNEAINIGAAQELTIGAAQIVTIGAERVSTVGRDDQLTVGKKLSITAGDEISITTGKASIVMKKDGTIVIKGKDISLEGSGKISVKASKDVTVKGQKISQN